MAIDKLAKQEGWTSVTAVTERPHNRRVRTNLERCTDLYYSVVSIDDFNITSAPARIASKQLSEALRVGTVVVPAAGMGTRFLPATKTVPKNAVAGGRYPGY